MSYLPLRVIVFSAVATLTFVVGVYFYQRVKRLLLKATAFLIAIVLTALFVIGSPTGETELM